MDNIFLVDYRQLQADIGRENEMELVYVNHEGTCFTHTQAIIYYQTFANNSIVSFSELRVITRCRRHMEICKLSMDLNDSVSQIKNIHMDAKSKQQQQKPQRRLKKIIGRCESEQRSSLCSVLLRMN